MKTILITGATDGIGLETAKMLAQKGHHILLHGRSADKLHKVKQMLMDEYAKPEQEGQLDSLNVSTLCADLSRFADLRGLVNEIKSSVSQLDVIINNAGVFVTSNPTTGEGLDVRFMVNTLSPYVLSTELLSIMPEDGRVINVSSAAQAPVDVNLVGAPPSLSDGLAYDQSKLALTMFTQFLGEKYSETGPSFISVNPKSLLGSKMVKEAYGIAGGNLKEGAEIFVKAALSESFAKVKGAYFDNDAGRFAAPHGFALSQDNRTALISSLHAVLDKHYVEAT